MFYVYVLKSIIYNFYYTGCTDNLKKRFFQHNKREVESTKPYKPFKIIYYEACLNIKDAFIREKYLKSRRGKLYLKYRLKYWIDKVKE